MLFLHTITEDETMYSVADMFGTTMEKICMLNNISMQEPIAGRRLLLHSGDVLPAWMRKDTLCFDDLSREQICALQELLCERDPRQMRQTAVQKVQAEPVASKTAQAQAEPIAVEARAQPVVVKPAETKMETELVQRDLPVMVPEQPEEKAAPVQNAQQEKPRASKAVQAETPEGHVVKAGETLSALAAQYGLTARIVQKANGVQTTLEPGTRLNIPAPQGRRYFYTVRVGDTPEKVANKFGVNRDKLMQNNYLDEGEALLPGTQLMILI